MLFSPPCRSSAVKRAATCIKCVECNIGVFLPLFFVQNPKQTIAPMRVPVMYLSDTSLLWPISFSTNLLNFFV